MRLWKGILIVMSCSLSVSLILFVNLVGEEQEVFPRGFVQVESFPGEEGYPAPWEEGKTMRPRRIIRKGINLALLPRAATRRMDGTLPWTVPTGAPTTRRSKGSLDAVGRPRKARGREAGGMEAGGREAGGRETGSIVAGGIETGDREAQANSLERKVDNIRRNRNKLNATYQNMRDAANRADRKLSRTRDLVKYNDKRRAEGNGPIIIEQVGLNHTPKPLIPHIIKPNPAGLPLFVHLLSYQRTGSSFTGGLFYSNPDAFYLYEPLDMIYTAMYAVQPGWSVPTDIFYMGRGKLRRLPPDELSGILWVMERMFTCRLSELPLPILLHVFWPQFGAQGHMPDAIPYVRCMNDAGVRMQENSTVYDECRLLLNPTVRDNNDLYRFTNKSGYFNHTKYKQYQREKEKLQREQIGVPRKQSNFSHLCPKRFQGTYTNLERCLRVMWNNNTWTATREEVVREYNARAAEKVMSYYSCMRRHEEAARKCAHIHLDNVCSSRPIRVIKTVRASYSVSEKLLFKFPQLKVIHLLRDPGGVAFSRNQNGWTRGKLQNKDIGTDAAGYCFRAADDAYRLDKVKLRHHPGRVMTLILEQLVEETNAAFRGLQQFLDIPLAPQSLKYISDKIHGVQNVSKVDVKVMRTKDVLDLVNKASRWQHLLTPAQTLAIRKACKSFYNITGHTWASNRGTLILDRSKITLIHVLGYERGGANYIGGILDGKPELFYLADPEWMIYFLMHGITDRDIRRISPGQNEESAILWFMEKVYTCEFSSLPTRFLLHGFWAHAQNVTDDFTSATSNYTRCMTSRGDVSIAHAYERCRQELDGMCEDPGSCVSVLWGNNSWGEEGHGAGRGSVLFDRYFHCFAQYKSAARICAAEHLDRTCQERRVRVVKTTSVSMEVSRTLMGRWDNFKVIHVLRDPRSVSWSRGVRSEGDPRDVVTHAREYCARGAEDDCVRKVMAAANQGRTMRVIFEDFIDFNYQHDLARELHHFVDLRFTFINPTKGGYKSVYLKKIAKPHEVILSDYEKQRVHEMGINLAEAKSHQRWRIFSSPELVRDVERVCSALLNKVQEFWSIKGGNL